MKRISLVLFICFCFCNLYSQNSNDIVIGKVESIDSKILNEQRKVWIYTPRDYSDGVFEKKNYPVVYLLDGDAHFYSVVGMIQQLSSVNGNTICPKMIVVGIPNTNRTRDLTPSKGKSNPLTNSNMIADSGGGANFMSFIEKELIPYINANYRTEPYRMLIGHSFGGLTVMNTLIHQPHLFNSYISIDPSMWWSEKKLLNEIKQIKLDDKYHNKTLYLGIANTMSPSMDLKSVQKDSTFDTQHIRSILELNTILNEDAQKKLSYKGKFYEDDDHGSVPLIATYDAFRFIFDFYRLKLEMEDYLDPESDILDKIINHYNKLSKEFGMKMKPDEAYINSLGYQFMSMKQAEKSEQFFKLNVVNYPESFNVYDSLGDFYTANGKKEKAIKNYKKSVLLNKDSNSKRKLKELKKK